MFKMNLAAVVLVAALTAGFAFGLLRPGMRALRTCQAEVSAKQVKVQAGQQELGNVGDLYASIVQLDEAMNDFRVRLPQERRFGEFLNDLSDLLRKCEIDDYVVQPKPALHVDETKLPDALRLTAGTTVLRVSIAFSASFARVFEFLDGVERMPRLSRIKSIKLLNDEQRPGEIRAEILVHTYQYVGQGNPEGRSQEQ